MAARPAIAKQKNNKAPNDPTVFDNMSMGNLQNEYYRIKLLKMKMEDATQGLSEKEQEVMKQPSDLDMLTAKILLKLKTLADHDPHLNTYRAITGKESREEIASDLATRHYNKFITDKYIGELVNSQFTNNVVSGRDGVRRDLGAAVLENGLARAGPGAKAANVVDLLRGILNQLTD